jgi:hypothetical protein
MENEDLLTSESPAICPPVDAILLWMNASGVETVKDRAAEQLFSGFNHRYGAKYLSLFRGLEFQSPISDGAFGPRQEKLVDHAVHETQSLLRRLAVLSVGQDPNDMHSDFEENAIYQRAALAAEKLVSRFRSGGVSLTSCPRCKTVGELGTWFGTRVVNDKRIPQSWCRICRVRGAYLSPPVKR